VNVAPGAAVFVEYFREGEEQLVRVFFKADPEDDNEENLKIRGLPQREGDFAVALTTFESYMNEKANEMDIRSQINGDIVTRCGDSYPESGRNFPGAELYRNRIYEHYDLSFTPADSPPRFLQSVSKNTKSLYFSLTNPH